jgi:hypothetical protein
MRSHSKWITGVSVLVVLSLGAGQVVPAAFARNAGDSFDEEKASASESAGQASPSTAAGTQNVAATSAPSARLAVAAAQKIAPVRILGVSAARPPQTPAAAAAARLSQAPAPQAQAPKKSGVWKWILIGAGAGVGVAFLATRGESTPVITVGTLVVERPQ